MVLLALGLTLGIFVFLSLFACQTKYDFTSWIPYMGVALWGLILFGFMYIFLPKSSTSELIYGLVIAVVFSGYILIDTQLIIRHYHVEEEIAAAVSTQWKQRSKANGIADQPVSRHPQSLPGHSEDPEQPAEQLSRYCAHQITTTWRIGVRINIIQCKLCYKHLVSFPYIQSVLHEPSRRWTCDSFDSLLKCLYHLVCHS